MGRKIDALLGRRRFFYSSKLKALLNLSLSRLSFLRNRCHVRNLHARSDVLQLLHLGHHERALLRVGLATKEQNLFDVYVMIEGYCNLLIERSNLLERQRECPDELKEAISGLLFASFRCGDFPELVQIRRIFASHFGKEFTDNQDEMKNNCGVNPMMVQKLSTKQQNLGTRMKILKETAFENSISLQLDQHSEDLSGELLPTKSTNGHEDENKQCSPLDGSDDFSEKLTDKGLVMEKDDDDHPRGDEFTFSEVNPNEGSGASNSGSDSEDEAKSGDETKMRNKLINGKRNLMRVKMKHEINETAVVPTHAEGRYNFSI